MKKIALFVAVMLAAASMTAQRMVETVHLKNGGLVKGEIIEQVPGESLKVKTKDGNIFVYRMDEVEKITKEENGETQTAGHKGLDFNVDLGYDIATKGGGGNLVAGLELGKRFNKNFYWGIGAGAYIPSGDGDFAFPITTDFKVYYPLKTSKIAPFLGLKAGYVINTADDTTVGSGKYQVTVSQPDYIMIEIMPGVQMPLSNSIDFNLGIGYTHFIPTEGSGGNGAIAIRVGFGFHKSNTPNIRESVPTRDSGYQLTLEADGLSLWNSGSSGSFVNYGGNIVVGYKLNPNISFGVGYGGAFANTFGWGYGMMNKYFIRGQYRLNDNKFSPVANVDLGLRSVFFEDYYYGRWSDLHQTSLFISPSVGFSLRTTNNSYFEMRVGYAISEKLDDRYKYYNDYDDIKQIGTSGGFVTIGWTHTFGFGK